MIMVYPLFQYIIGRGDYNLLGGAITILKNDGLRQFCPDDIPYGK
jgi:hypothetical protein